MFVLQSQINPLTNSCIGFLCMLVYAGQQRVNELPHNILNTEAIKNFKTAYSPSFSVVELIFIPCDWAFFWNFSKASSVNKSKRMSSYDIRINVLHLQDMLCH